MFCNDCGHEIGDSSVCPICGWQKPKAEFDATPKKSEDGLDKTVLIDQDSKLNQKLNEQLQNHNVQQTLLNQQLKQKLNQYNMPNQNMANPNMVNPNMVNPNMANSNMVNPNMVNPNMANSNMHNPNMPYNNGYYNQPYQAYPPRKKKVWPFILLGTITLIAIITIVAVIFFANKDDNDNDKTTTEDIGSIYTTSDYTISDDKKEKTIIIYMVGSDLESKWQCGTNDIQEMIDSHYDESKINIVILAGGTTNWKNQAIPDGYATKFVISDGMLKQLDSPEKVAMSSPDTLTKFLSYAYENFPAEEYSLILWNHGGGSFFGYGHDEVFGGMLSVEDIKNAIDASSFSEENKFEWIGFDACLMSTVEVTAMLEPYTHYLIASQESEPGIGWNYSFLADIDNLHSGDEIGKEICDHFYDACVKQFGESWSERNNFTLAVLDCTKFDNVQSCTDDLFSKADGDLSSTTFIKHSRVRANTKELASQYTDDESLDMVDMVDLTNNMAQYYPTESEALSQALDEFIVYNRTNEENANGVSIYYPYNSKIYSRENVSAYEGFGFSQNYRNFIRNFCIYLNDTNVLTADWSPYTLIPYSGNGYNFSVDMSSEQTAEYQNAYFAISRQDIGAPENYVFVGLSNEVNLNGNTLTANFDGEIIYMQNDTTGEHYEIMYKEQESTPSYTRYLIPCIVYNNSIEDENDALYIYLVLEVTPTNEAGTIIGAYPLENFIQTEGGDVYPERMSIDINDYTYIAFGSLSHEFTSNEDLTEFNESDWSDVNILYKDMPISEGFSTVLGGMQQNVPYYGMFVIEDAQGERHCSELFQIQ